MTIPATNHGQTDASSAVGEAVAAAPQYHVAQLPEEEVEKLQHLEEELRADTGAEVIVIAYEKEPEEADADSAPSSPVMEASPGNTAV